MAAPRSASGPSAWRGWATTWLRIVKALGYDKVDVLGYSLGGGVAFRMAVQHPEAVRRLVLVSTGYAADGFYDEMRGQQAQVSAAAADFMKDTPMYKSYVAVAPRPTISRNCSTRSATSCARTMTIPPMSPS